MSILDGHVTVSQPPSSSANHSHPLLDSQPRNKPQKGLITAPFKYVNTTFFESTLVLGSKMPMTKATPHAATASATSAPLTFIDPLSDVMVQPNFGVASENPLALADPDVGESE